VEDVPPAEENESPPVILQAVPVSIETGIDLGPIEIRHPLAGGGLEIMRVMNFEEVRDGRLLAVRCQHPSHGSACE
jgi:hypothetical protein